MKAHIQVPKPLPPLRLEPGARVRYGDQWAIVQAVYGPERIHLRLQPTNALITTSVDALCTAPPEPRAPAIAHPVDSNPAQEEKARRWLQHLAVLPANATRTQQQQLAARLEVSLRTVARRLKRYRCDPTLAGQLDAWPGPASGTRRLGTLQEELIEQAYESLYLVREHPPVTELHMEACRLCRHAGIPAPSYQAVRARARRKDPMRAAIKRLGPDQARARQAPAIGCVRATGALSDVQIDHALCDVQVVSALDGQVIGRPWITVAIDIYTRCVIGFYLGLEAPNQTAVVLCLEHSVFPKQDWLNSIKAKVDYPMFGKMERLHCDNAKTFRATAIQAQCERYGIQIVDRPARRPHYGAHIERYIGTLMRAMHLTPGTTFSNPQQKGDYDSGARACLTMSELEQWVTHEVAGVYHNKRHRGLGDISPATAWRLAWKDEGGAVHLPPLVGDRRNFVCGLLPFKERTVHRDGIALYGVRYWDPVLAPLINSHTKYRVHYHQGNMARVYLCWDDQYVDVPCRDRARAPFALWQLQDAKRHLAEQHCVTGSESALFDAIEAKAKIVEAAARRSRIARRKQALRPQALDSPNRPGPDYTRPPRLLSGDWEDVP